MSTDIVAGYPVLSRYRGKISTPEEAVSIIKPGDGVLVGTACATPRILIQALEQIDLPIPDVQLYHFLTTGAVLHKDGI